MLSRLIVAQNNWFFFRHEGQGENYRYLIFNLANAQAPAATARLPTSILSEKNKTGN
jgi:hypothetical protein